MSTRFKYLIVALVAAVLVVSLLIWIGLRSSELSESSRNSVERSTTPRSQTSAMSPDDPFEEALAKEDVALCELVVDGARRARCASLLLYSAAEGKGKAACAKIPEESWRKNCEMREGESAQE